MTIPFLSFFKKSAPKENSVRRPLQPMRVEKPSGQRLSKTVMPNTTRTVEPREDFELSGSSGNYSLGSTSKSDLPPAVALALEPKVERVISLELKDVVPQAPNGWIRPVSDAEGSRRILLKAAEIEKGMSSGRPCVCLTSVYKQVPEIFLRPVPHNDEAQVPLPFAKVLEEFGKLRTRNDQTEDQTVPQLETPFLRMTLEDNTRFGIEMAPVHTSDVPPVTMEPATAQAIAAAEPEFIKFPRKSSPKSPAAAPEISVVRAKDGNAPTIKLPVEELSEAVPPPAPQTQVATTPAPTRIPFKISPIGTGEPASERVPASSGPSVPTSSSAPTRIAFQMNAPGEFQAVEQTESPQSRISLALKPIFAALPPFQLSGDISTVPEDAQIEIPFSLVEPQLSSGRISLEAEQFAKILPEQYRNFFSANEINTPVILPLQDVLKNLPSSSLRMRDDQEQEEKGADFQTPFAAKAAEDAKRFAPPAERKPLKGLPQVVPKLKPALPEIPKAEVPKPPVAQENLPNESNAPAVVDHELDAKAIVADLGKLSGVNGCAIVFSDGLSLAGNLPGEFQAEGLCAMAPSFIERLNDHVGATKLGALAAITLSCAKAAVTFFMHDNLCLAALHASGELAPEVRERLAAAVHDLSQKYSLPA